MHARARDFATREQARKTRLAVYVRLDAAAEVMCGWSHWNSLFRHVQVAFFQFFINAGKIFCDVLGVFFRDVEIDARRVNNVTFDLKVVIWLGGKGSRQ